MGLCVYPGYECLAASVADHDVSSGGFKREVAGEGAAQADLVARSKDLPWSLARRHCAVLDRAHPTHIAILSLIHLSLHCQTVLCWNCFDLENMHRYVYQRSAARESGKDMRMLGLPFAHEWLRDKGHGIRSQFNAVSGAVDMMNVQKEGQRMGENQAPEAIEAFFRQKQGEVSVAGAPAWLECS